MKEITLKFREVAVDGLPAKTGYYFVVQSFPISEQANDIHFSAAHGLWNAFDYAPLEVAQKTAIAPKDNPHSGEITHWMPRAELEKALMEETTNAD